MSTCINRAYPIAVNCDAREVSGMPSTSVTAYGTTGSRNSFTVSTPSRRSSIGATSEYFQTIALSPLMVSRLPFARHLSAMG